MTVKRPLIVLAATLAAASALAACGGPATVTKHDVVAQADAICSTTLGQARALRQTGASEAAYFGRLATLVAGEAKKLRALPRPPKDQAVLNLFIASVGRAAGEYRQLAAAALRGDKAGVSRLVAQLAASPESGYAASYGLRECAGTSGTLVSS